MAKINSMDGPLTLSTPKKNHFSNNPASQNLYDDFLINLNESNLSFVEALMLLKERIQFAHSSIEFREVEGEVLLSSYYLQCIGRLYQVVNCIVKLKTIFDGIMPIERMISLFCKPVSLKVECT